MTVKVTREAEPQIELYGAYSGQLDGNGRVSLTFVAADTYLIMVAKNAVSRPQLELGAFATSYIPTAASTVTRNADVASLATSQFPYSASEGTLVAAFDFLGYKTNTVMTVVSAGTDNSNLIRLFQFSSSNVQSGAQLGYSSIVSGLFQADQNIKSAPAVGTVYKSAAAFKANDFAGCADGGTVLIDTSGAMPSATTFGVGMSPAKTNQLNGHLRQITYIPRRLTNAELQSRTA